MEHSGVSVPRSFPCMGPGQPLRGFRDDRERGGALSPLTLMH